MKLSELHEGVMATGSHFFVRCHWFILTSILYPLIPILRGFKMTNLQNTTFDSDKKMTMFGVEGRLTQRTVKPNMQTGLWFKQKWVSKSRKINGYSENACLTVEIKFDDECGNRNNSFAITGYVKVPQTTNWEACGCLHDDIAKVFPELAHLIKYHLIDSEIPLHYIASTVYLAGNLDHNGRAKGEVSNYENVIRFGNSPVSHKIKKSFSDFIASRKPNFSIAAIAYEKTSNYDFKPHFTLNGYGEKWHDCPFDSEGKAREFCEALNTIEYELVTIPTEYSDGKERELNNARDAACWPEATDEQLCLPKLELIKLLNERLDGLMTEFKNAMLSCGFLLSPEDYKHVD